MAIKVDVKQLGDATDEFQGEMVTDDGTRTVTTVHKTWHRAYLSISQEMKRHFAREFKSNKTVSTPK